MNPDLVYDIGAHRGEDTDYYLRLGFRVVCVECDPAHVLFLKERFQSEIQNGSLTLIDRAISLNSGQVTYYQNKEVSVWGTTEKSFAERNASFGTTIEELSVETVDPKQLFQHHGIPFYLKIDIEGADTIVLQALAAFQQKPPYLSVEAEGRSFEKLTDEFRLLKSLGYNEFKLSPQHYVHLQHVPARPRHGKPVDHVFLRDSSGAFGEDLEGSWLTQTDAIRYYKSIFVQYDLERALRTGLLQGSYKDFLTTYGYEPVWYDTHARHSSYKVDTQ
jgi:FkbM family methyltransferase